MCDSWPLTGSSSTESPRTEDLARRSESRVAFRRAARSRTPGRNGGFGSLAPCSASNAGLTKSSKPTRADTGLPGNPKTRVWSANAKRDRLSRPHCHSPKNLFDAQTGLGLAYEVVHPNRNASRRDQEIGIQTTFQSSAKRGGDRRGPRVDARRSRRPIEPEPSASGRLRRRSHPAQEADQERGARSRSRARRHVQPGRRSLR